MSKTNETKKPETCGYWEREAIRDADDHGFGASPYDFMTPEQADALDSRRRAEDEKDPPCENCLACLASEASSMDGPPAPGEEPELYVRKLTERADAAGLRDLSIGDTLCIACAINVRRNGGDSRREKATALSVVCERCGQVLQ